MTLHKRHLNYEKLHDGRNMKFFISFVEICFLQLNSHFKSIFASRRANIYKSRYWSFFLTGFFQHKHWYWRLLKRMNAGESHRELFDCLLMLFKAKTIFMFRNILSGQHSNWSYNSWREHRLIVGYLTLLEHNNRYQLSGLINSEVTGVIGVVLPYLDIYHKILLSMLEQTRTYWRSELLKTCWYFWRQKYFSVPGWTQQFYT